jgi:hypothetical protein
MNVSDGITMCILGDLMQRKFPRNSREKLVCLLWAMHLIRHVPRGPPTLEESVSNLVAEARKLKTL